MSFTLKNKVPLINNSSIHAMQIIEVDNIIKLSKEASLQHLHLRIIRRNNLTQKPK